MIKWNSEQTYYGREAYSTTTGSFKIKAVSTHSGKADLYIDIYGIDEYDGSIFMKEYASVEEAMEEGPRVLFEIVDGWFREVLTWMD